MTRRLTVVSAVIGAVAGFTLLPAMADTTSTPVLKTMLEGMPGTEANIVVFDIEPGWKTEHHHHPGHVFVYVLEGSIHLEIDGQDPMDFSAGEALYEVPNVGMVGSNASTTERAKFVVFQVGEAGKPLMVED